MQYIAPLAKLIEHFRALPGIGSKTAVRLAYHILDMDADKAKALAQAIVEAKEKIGYCNTCFNLSDSNPCRICASETRDHSTICVVQDGKDVIAIERIKQYKGVYHVLHGVISTSKGIMPDDLSIDSLVSRVSENVEEVILATNPTVEGEMTALYLAKRLESKVGKITRLAHGLPMGAHMDYADELTLIKAMEGRQKI